jgi:predicted unusual protein kinase regulating ubiquinone biosynthesis (AarF/ABC1/UbiB family)
MPKERRLTTSRAGRLSQLGRLAGSLAGGALAEGARQLASGRRPTLGDMLLTPGNAHRLGERLSEMRGAAMKVGQLLSMDDGHILPPQLSQILARLREDAHRMPLGQVAQVLEREWGDNWQARFSRFNFTPIAAASIGQVHEAILKDGQRVAIKVQYPGVRDSIDSDVDNVATLLRLSRLLPEGLDLGPLLAAAKHQLHSEADYRQEADSLRRYGRLVADDTRFELPDVFDELTSEATLTMRFLDGQAIESLREAGAAQRNAAGGALLELALREVFDWGTVQTDPNFANFRYAADTRRLQLLDFGATRDYPPETVADLQRLLAACIEGSDSDVLRAAARVGYIDLDDPEAYQRSIVALLRTVTEPLEGGGDYVFGASDLAERMTDQVLKMRAREGFTRLPPPPVLFLHRKLGGLYLLLSTLRARVPVAELAQRMIAPERPQVPHPAGEVV